MDSMHEHRPWIALEPTKLVGPCEPCPGVISPNGYGRTSVNGRRVYAHRAAYERHYGPIPNGMTVDHLCFDRSCVNVDHLQLLPFSENRRRQRRAMAPACHKGHLFSEANTYWHKGRRQCRPCRAEANRRYKASL